MNIQYLSDLHLEFPRNSIFFKENPIIKKSDILIMAGDIMNIHQKNEYFLDYISREFEQVYWIAGNHEFYGSTIPDGESYELLFRDNVMLLNNTSKVINETIFIFSTMWTNIKPDIAFMVKENLNDFHHIKNMTIAKYNYLHDISMNFIGGELKKQHNNKVVVTHHVPTFFNKNPEYNNFLDAAFYVENFDFIYDYKPDFWIYGHNHYNVEPFKINETTLLTNQFGYIGEKTSRIFLSEKIFSI